ncbi:metallophosphoesterase [Meiothermus hypogaeus]|uniref:3',5'-cyclic adenosine monophosphate phosphodiesterase CpdA n=2 Tax=Meiothermus hypogaeus TaxID=884155 RepID=A0ABX9MS39_9DEIN|nr:metallophosphoesterase [Meiothermus hypogaeus]RIH81070.1 3',5'-cyclic adenosine monophosphate phosphodiesterase CpdA [Meiothermus hypogaeus]GEM83306.1 putative metallophosphoesterase [Meiothermus hypogaeus NBRC 106114]
MLSRRRFLTLLGLGGVALSGASALAVGSSFQFQINRHRRVLPGLDRPLRVVQLSDLHYGFWVHATSVQAWVRAANAEKPDLVVITGDLVESGLRLEWLKGFYRAASPDLQGLLAALGGLRAPLGVFAIWGNHDNGLPQVKRYLGAQLPKHGVGVLTNQGLWVRDDLYLSGVDDYWAEEANPKASLDGYRKGKASLALVHNPDFWDFYQDLPVHLLLSGHTHGGQVYLPGIGAPWTPSHYQQAYLGGWYSPGLGPASPPVPGFVSRGLGMTVLPLRINAPAELVVFDFIPEG